MKKILQIWQNIKQPLDIWFFFLFIFTFSLSIRKVILYFPLQGTFNEWTGIYIYISDVFLLLVLITWLYNIVSHNYSLLSSVRLWTTWSQHNLSTMSRCFLSRYYLSVPLFLVIWSFLSISWSGNQTIAFFRSLKLLELYLLFLYVSLRFVPSMFHACPVICSTLVPLDRFVPRGTNLNFTGWNKFYGVEQNTLPPYQGEGGRRPDEVINVPRGTIINFTSWNILTGIIIFVAFVNSLVAIVQIWIQKSVGLGFLRESIISPDTPGVAKVMFHGEHYIRAYGLFPHPNILGGFLLMSIVLTLLWVKMFHVEQKQPSTQQRENSATTMSRPNSICGASRLSMFHVEHYSVLRCRTFQFAIYALLAIQLLALTLTFSKSAALGLVVSLIYLYHPHVRRMFHPVKSLIVSHETIKLHGVNVKQNTYASFQRENCQNPGETKNIPFKTIHQIVSSTLAPLNVPRGTFVTGWNNSKWRIATLAILIVLALALIFYQDLERNLNQSFDERLAYLNVSRGTILANPILGAGIGQFVGEMLKYSSTPLEPWQFQPVHNVFLLIWSELGLIGLALFIFFLYNVFQPINNKIVPPRKNLNCSTPAPLNVSCETFFTGWNNLNQRGKRETYSNDKPNNITVPRLSREMFHAEHFLRDETINNILTTYHKYLQSIIIGFIFIMLWDHYNFDIQQGEAAMWIVFGLAAGISSVAGKNIDN